MQNGNGEIIWCLLAKSQYPFLGYAVADLYKCQLLPPRGAVLKDAEHRNHYRALLAQLKQARADVGLTQFEAARKLRKPQSFISKIESGERRIDFIEMQFLARLYRKPLSFFEMR
jgi:Helix-turn-helix